MSMHNPEMYEKFIAFQKRDASYCLQKFGDKMNWKENASVIDLGCGDGFVTSAILKNHLPPNFNKLIGTDISQEMVEFASAKYGDDKTSFMHMDISGDVPGDLKGAFDHAFSSYMLQFVPDQEKAFSNIFDLLSEGGTCLLLFLGHSLLYNPYIEMVKQEKWCKHTKDVEKILHYYNMQDPAEDITRLMTKAGFRNVHVEANKTSFEYETYGHLRSMVECANLFHLSPELLKEFMNYFDKIMFEMKYVDEVPGKPAVKLNYTRIIVYGSK